MNFKNISSFNVGQLKSLRKREKVHSNENPSTEKMIIDAVLEI
jgi:hypothetical protein